MREAEFTDWLERLTSRYARVTEVCVTGSRVFAEGRRPKSRKAEWEVVVFLDQDACYEEVQHNAPLQTRYRVLDDTAARIASDPDLRSPAIDLFFWLPCWTVVNWSDTQALAEEFIQGSVVTHGEWARLCRKLSSAKLTWSRD